MKTWFGIALLIVSMLGSAFGQCSEAEKKALEAFDRSWAKASQSGDRAGLMNIYSDDFRSMDGRNGKAEAVENTMATYERNKANPENRDDVTYDRYMITCTPNSATVTHRNIVKTQFGEGGKPETFWTRSIHVLEKHNGKWQIVSTTANDMDDYMMLEYMEQDWNDANLTRNKAWFEENFAPDFVSISSMTGKLYNKSEDIESTVSDKGTVELAETTNVNVRIDRSYAVVTGIYRWKGKDENGKAYDNRIRYIDTFVKRNGKWLVWSSSGSVIK